MKKIIIAVFVFTILNNKISTGQSPSIVLPIGHFENVTDANYSQDGKKISTTSQDRTVKIWNPQNGRLLLTLSDFGVMDIVSRVLFSPDGRTLMTINELGQVK
ncbi:MAG TPA: hypothetical protein VK155_19405, partial [Bacteroidales bacterium]|nr:hypothetical protein [Bacteroidales bacterium]